MGALLNRPALSFGDMRALAQQPASSTLWKRLCQEIERWPDAKERDERLIPYLAGALRHWPDELLVAPHAWVQQFLSNHPTPYLYIARHLEIQGLWLDRARARRLTHAPQLANIRVLTLHGSRQAPQLLAELLAQSSWVPTLHTLRLHHNAIGIEREDLLESLGRLERLEHLELVHMSLDGQDARALLQAPIAAQLRTLDLSHNALGAHAMEVLQDVSLPRLEALGLKSTRQHTVLGHMLSGARDLTAIKRLDLAHNVIAEEGVREIVAARFAPHLTHLDMAYAHLTDGAILALVERVEFEAMRSLVLYGNRLTDRAAIALSRAEHLDTLEVLRLEFNEIGAPGWFALAKSHVLNEALRVEFDLQSKP